MSVRFHIADEGGGVRAPGIVVRSQDSLTHYYVHYDSKHSQVIIVRSEPAKTWNELKRVPGIPITSQEWHTARVTCIGTHIAAYLDGKVVAEADDATLDSGIVALRAGQGRILFDNLEVRGAEVDLTAAEHLRIGLEFGMGLKADDRIELHRHTPVAENEMDLSHAQAAAFNGGFRENRKPRISQMNLEQPSRNQRGVSRE